MRILDASILATGAIGSVLFMWNRTEGGLASPQATIAERGIDDVLSSYRTVCPPATVKEATLEYELLSTDALREELVDLHQLFHETRAEILRNTEVQASGIMIATVPNDDRSNLDLDSTAITEFMESLGPAFIDRRQVGDDWAAFAVPLPYEQYEGFWETKLRLGVVQSLLDRGQ